MIDGDGGRREAAGGGGVRPCEAHIVERKCLAIDVEMPRFNRLRMVVRKGRVVRTAIGRLAERLSKFGVTVADTSALLPNLADSARLYMKLLWAAIRTRMPSDRFAETARLAAALTLNDHSLQAERVRGAVMSHRDWHIWMMDRGIPTEEVLGRMREAEPNERA